MRKRNLNLSIQSSSFSLQGSASDLTIPPQSPRFYPLSQPLNDLLLSIQPVYPIEQFNDERLKIYVSNPLGHGSTGNVFAGQLDGKDVAIKRTEIDSEFIKKFQMRANIFRTLIGIGNLLLPSHLFIGHPSYDGIGVSVTSSDLIGYFYEVYPICKTYTLPHTIHLFLPDLRIIINAFLQMHHKNIAHLDFKIENMMRKSYDVKLNNMIPQSEDNELVLIDLGESRFTFMDNEDTLSTTISLIIHNYFIEQIVMSSVEGSSLRQSQIARTFLTDNEFGRTLKGLLMHKTPDSGYRLIDALMFGIFLINLPIHLAKAQFQTQSIPHTLEDYGKKLILSALRNLYRRFWCSEFAPVHGLSAEPIDIYFNFLRGIENQIRQHHSDLVRADFNLIDLKNILFK